MTDVDMGEAPGGEGGGEAAATHWTSGIEDRGVLDQVGGYESPAALATAYAGLRKERDGQQHIIGKRAAEIAADPELMAIARQSMPDMAPPESADAYDFSTIPEEVKAFGWDDEIEGRYRAHALEAGFNKAQFDGLVKFHGEIQAEQMAAQADAIEAMANETERTLRAEWGRSYEGKRQDVVSAIDRLFPNTEIRDQVFHSGALADLETVAAFAEVGEALRGVGRLPGADAKGAAVMTPEQAEAELDRLMSDPKTGEILADKMSAEARQLKAKMDELARLAFPED